MYDNQLGLVQQAFTRHRCIIFWLERDRGFCSPPKRTTIQRRFVI